MQSSPWLTVANISLPFPTLQEPHKEPHLASQEQGLPELFSFLFPDAHEDGLLLVSVLLFCVVLFCLGIL